VQVTGVCGIPSGAASLAGNLTAVAPADVGYLTLSPGDESSPTSTLNYRTGVTRANNFVLGLSSSGQLRLASSSTLHAIIDASGYFMSPANLESWTLTFRDEGNRISSEYLGASRQKDYFYLGNLLVATRTGAGAFLYYASDHLGTPRLVTNSAIPVAKVEDHSYDAFGIELTSTFGNQPLKFAAMERDTLSKNDYAHARFQSSDLGRFLSPDSLNWLDWQLPGADEQQRFQLRLLNPQLMNRYSYAGGNPLRFVDPDGQDVAAATAVFSVFGNAPTSLLLGSPAALPISGMMLAAGVGVLIGTGINQLPGVSETVTRAWEVTLDATVHYADNNRHRADVAAGLIGVALRHLEKVSSAGGPEKDPASRHHKKEIKTFLDRASDVIKRLPGKQRKELAKLIKQIAERAGLE
jgi:RHS repeat-associated protein